MGASHLPKQGFWMRRFAYGAVSGRCVLVGDAAHPMTPNLGQGGCTALEVRRQLCCVAARVHVGV